MTDTIDKTTVDLPALHDELKYCLEFGEYGNRTGAALLWALELIEDLRRERAA